MTAVSSSSNLIEMPTLDKKLLLSNINNSSKVSENTTSAMLNLTSIENVNKYNYITNSPGSVSESIMPALQQRPDDELTSLTWLQDSNLLFGTGLSQMKVSRPSEKNDSAELNGVTAVAPTVTRPPKMEEVTIKYEELEESPEIKSPAKELSLETHDSSEKEDEILESQKSAGIDQDPVPYNPQIHLKSKPPYSFSSLIFMAIEDSIEKALPVKDIYSWVILHFPYYKGVPTGWKNSVRHNLSLNKCFRKVDKSPTLGKGSLWMVDPAYRPNLLQTLNKTPFHSANRTDHIYVTNIRSALNQNPLDLLNRLKGAPVETEEPIDVSSQLSNKPIYKNGQSVDEEQGCDSPSNSLHSQTYFNIELQERPMLLKQVHKDDVDAAAAMLVLKHGPMILQEDPHFTFKNLESHVSSMANGVRIGRKRKQFHTELQDPNHVLVSSCANLDHSYVTATEDCVDDDEKDTKKRKSFVESSGESCSSLGNERTNKDCLANNKKYVPLFEANALLKLASIATSLESTDIHQNMTYFNGHLPNSDILPSDVLRINESNSDVTSHSSKMVTSDLLNIQSRKKKNLHPVKRILNNEIKKLSNNNSCSIINKNNLGHLDYRL